MGSYVRVNRKRKCPICGKPDWCTIRADGSACKCMRTPSDRPVTSGGWIHKLNGNIRMPEQTQTTIKPNCEALANAFERAATSDRLVQGASRWMKVSVGSLRRLRMGWNVQSRADTFPMKNEHGKIVGIRLRVRDESARKLSVKGGKEGLFIPTGFDPRKPFCIVEGPTDAAAMLDLGFETIGRPSNLGGLGIVLGIIAKYRPHYIVAVGDNDKEDQNGRRPGTEGVNQLLMAIAQQFKGGKALAIYPPEGIKDVREWLVRGAKHEDVVQQIRYANYNPWAKKGGE